MTTYFIDFQNGCDENDGLRPETPFRTQHPELLQPDDTVLFRRGSVFRGPLQNPSGRWEHPIHYGAYGEGEPPVFCGSQSLSDASLWKSVGKNIWQYTGILASEAANLIYGDGTCGALRWTREELCEQGDWFDSRLGYSIQHLPLAEDHTLLVYSQENPAAFYGSIECATSQYRWLAHCGHDMVISDLEFRNNGLHGIAGEEGGRNLRIENCRFAKIGGAVWDKDQKIRFGNAFECWNVAENVEVEHCVFDDIYDSAVTHQGGADCKPAYHFLIRSNTFRRCGMAAYEQRDLLPTYAEFTDNVCEDAGEGLARRCRAGRRSGRSRWDTMCFCGVFPTRPAMSILRSAGIPSAMRPMVRPSTRSIRRRPTGWYIWRRTGIRCSAIRWLAGCTV